MPAGRKPSDRAPLSTSGIQTLPTGHSVIPSSVRSDGSTRKEIKVRPGYQPPEDQEKYRNRIIEDRDQTGKRGIPGAEPVNQAPGSAGATEMNKNAKRREAARRKAAAAAAAIEGQEECRIRQVDNSALADVTNRTSTMQLESFESDAKTPDLSQDWRDHSKPASGNHGNERITIPVRALEEQIEDAAAEKEKKSRNLKKKLRQARDLKEKKNGGNALLPEQLAKVTKIQELIRELDKLGYDADG